MSIEIENKLFAHLTFIAANPPVLIRSDGFDATITRTAAGAYTARLSAEPGGLKTTGAGPVTALDYAASCNQLPIAGQMAALASFAYVNPADGRDVFIRCFDAAGAAVDGTTVQVLLWKLPTI